MRIWLDHMQQFMTKSRKLWLALLLTWAIPAYAMTLQQAMTALPQAKAQGIVGEQPNGYLGIVQTSQEAENIARLINEARRSEYQRLARDNGINLADVEAMAGQKAIERTQRGHFILVDGNWVQRR